MGFYNPIYKNERFFSSKTHILTPFAQDIYYSLLFTNMYQWRHGGRNILINLNLKESFLLIKSVQIHEYQHKSTRINTSQHEFETSLTQVNTSPTLVNTNQHESKTGPR